MFIYLYTQMNHREKKEKGNYISLYKYILQKIVIYIFKYNRRNTHLFVYIFICIYLYIYKIANNIVIYIFIYNQKKIDIYKGK